MDGTRHLIGVVDDDAAIGRSLERFLHSFGFAAHAYSSIAAFLSSKQLNHIACLILDIHMPELSGLELQDRLRADGHRFPIIFITGHLDDAIRERVMRSGAEDILEKPFDGQSLMDRIHKVLSGYPVLEETKRFAQ